jgi:DNA-binding XRE family transcriptional regulator
MTRPTFLEFKKKALSDPEVKEAYESLSVAYDLRKSLIALRKEAGLTQEDVAERLHTNKSNISRLENVNSEISPKLSTIEAYAKAVGYKVEINFVPQSSQII